MTCIGELLRDARSQEERRDREVLLTHVLGRDRAYLYAHPEKTLDATAQARLIELLERRRQREPIALITGHREFWGLDLLVTPAVLIPRPETELLVEEALRHAAPDARMLDLGTGSGAIALALASERPHARIFASDRSMEALDVCRRNAQRLGLHVLLVASDWLSAIRGHFDVIAANPPYVAADALLESDVGFEPPVALFGGRDGLECIAAIAREAPSQLTPGGVLLVEHGLDQGAAVRELFSGHGLVDVRTARDLAGRERLTSGRRVESARSTLVP